MEMEVEMEMEMELPIDIATNILSRLPFDSVIQLKCLSKYWYNLVQLLIHSGEFQFAQNHRSRLMENYTFLRYSYTNNYIHDYGSDDDAFSDSSSESDIHEYPCSSFSPSSLPDSVLLMLDDQSTTTTLHYAEYYEDKKGLFNCKAVKRLNCPLPLDMINNNISSNFWTLSTSSNGLVCSLVHDINSTTTNTNSSSYLFCIYNPFLGEYVTLPDDGQHMISSCTMAFGFSHIPSTNEYKVVRIVYPTDTPDGGCGGDVGNIEVYTLGSGGKWRSKGIIKRRLQCDTPGVLVNGSLHWLTEVDERYKKLKQQNIHFFTVEQEAEFMQKIMVFDLLEEEFDHMIRPPVYHANLRIKEWGGYLCGFNCRDELRMHDTWKFFMYGRLSKNKMIVDGEWKKIFSIQWKGGLIDRPYEDLYFYNKANQALLWTTYISKTKRKSYKSNSLVVVVEMNDLRGSSHARELHAAKLFHGIFHIKSFLSLKALGENNTKRIIDDDRKQKLDNNNKDRKQKLDNNNKDRKQKLDNNNKDESCTHASPKRKLLTFQ